MPRVLMKMVFILCGLILFSFIPALGQNSGLETNNSPPIETKIIPADIIFAYNCLAQNAFLKRTKIAQLVDIAGKPIAGEAVSLRTGCSYLKQLNSNPILTDTRGYIIANFELKSDSCDNQICSISMSYDGSALYKRTSKYFTIRMIKGPIPKQDVVLRLEPSEIEVFTDSQFQLKIMMDSPYFKVAAYGIAVKFDWDFLKLATQIKGVEPGKDGFVAAVGFGRMNNFVISGFDVKGIGPANNLEFLILNFVSKKKPGTSEIKFILQNLSDYNTQNLSGIIDNAVVKVKEKRLGDVNLDGQVDIVDALLIARFYIGFSDSAFTAEVHLGDVDLNGIVDIVDAFHIARYNVGIVQKLPVE